MTDVNKAEGGADEVLTRTFYGDETWRTVELGEATPVTVHQALAKLQSDLLAILGEDEILEPDYYEFTPEEITRNQLRAELREKIKEYFNG